MKAERVIPDFLSHLPTHRGYPVPYFVPKDENGVYQLKYASGEKINSCLAYHKCCVCFKPLVSKDYWFISGPMGLKNQVDSHSPMHQRCAEYSLHICPHLFFEKAQRTSEDSGVEYLMRDKPNELFLVKAKKFSLIRGEGGSMLIRYSSHKVVSEYEYVNGVLTKRDLNH